MTPQQLTGLAVLLLEYRDWLEGFDPERLDRELVNAVVDSVMRDRKALVEAGAK